MVIVLINGFFFFNTHHNCSLKFFILTFQITWGFFLFFILWVRVIWTILQLLFMIIIFCVFLLFLQFYLNISLQFLWYTLIFCWSLLIFWRNSVTFRINLNRSIFSKGNLIKNILIFYLTEYWLSIFTWSIFYWLFLISFRRYLISKINWVSDSILFIFCWNIMVTWNNIFILFFSILLPLF